MNVSAALSVVPLPGPLTAVLGTIPDGDFSGRLEKVYQAAATAIHRLTDMDLLRYESNTQPSASADLSLWEEMAPILRDTVMDVNALLTVIRAVFPERPMGLAETLSGFDVDGPAPVDLPARLSASEVAVGVARDQLALEITRLGEMVRSPAVMSDHWALLSELQACRSRFREEIGELVYRTASLFADVQRKDVVPGHAEEIRTAVITRSVLSDLARILGARQQKVREAELEDVLWNAEQLEKEMDAFGRTPAYRALKAQDKKALIDYRQQLRGLLSEGSPAKVDLEQLVDGYAELIRALGASTRPALLQENDRQAWAASGVKLEQAQLGLGDGDHTAAQALAEAAQAAQALYGLDEKLDHFLRRARKVPLTTLQGAELAQVIDIFRELLASLPVMSGDL